jgi:hypothetical protein
MGESGNQISPTPHLAGLRRGLEGPLRFIVHGARSRDGRLRTKPQEPRTQAMEVLDLVQRHLDELGVDRSLTRPLADICEAFAEAERGRVHPLFEPKRLKGRPPAALSQFYLMTIAAKAIDLLIAAGKTRQEAAGLVASRLRKRGFAIKGENPAQTLLGWRNDLTKAGRGQGLGRTNSDWHWYGSIYLLEKLPALMRRKGMLGLEAEAKRLIDTAPIP